MDKLDLAWWKFIADLVQLAVTVGVAIYVWILSKSKANAKRIDGLENATDSELDKVKNRLTRLETTVAHMPDKQAISNTHKRLDDQAKTLHKMEGELKGISDTSQMILQALIKRGEE